MKLTISRTGTTGPLAIGGAVGVLQPNQNLTIELRLDQLEPLKATLTHLQAVGLITWSTTASTDTTDDAAEGATVGLPQTTSIPNPSAPITTGTVAARTLAVMGPIVFEPTADCVIDIPGIGATAWRTTQSAVLRVYKGTRALFGILASVANDPTWTSPGGLGQDYWLPSSGDQMSLGYDIIIDGPNKTFRVMALPWGLLEPMMGPPTVGPGDTLDLFAGGTFTGHVITGTGGAGTYQIGAPTSDGSAFIAASVANTRRLQDLGDGNGPRLLIECARNNYCRQSETLFTGAAITAPWVALNGNTTGLGQQAGSPRGDATVTNLIFAADAATGVTQALTGFTSVDVSMTFSIWARCTAGTEKCQLQAVLKDGVSIRSSGDVVLTTTWQRIVLVIPSVGNFGGASSPEFRIVNGSDGAARTIQVWGAQAETGGSSVGAAGPSSYIVTVAATVTRSGDILWYAPGTWPTTLATRGVSFTYMPEFASVELYATGIANLINMNGDAATELDTLDGQAVFDGIVMRAFATGMNPAEGAARIYLGDGANYIPSTAIASVPGTPRNWTDPFVFARRDLLTIDAQAYRGGVRIQGATSGNRLYTLGGGPLVWGTGVLSIGGTAGLSGSTPQISASGSYGRFLTAA